MTVVRVVAGWSQFYGFIGRVARVADDHVMVVFDDDPRELRFGLSEVVDHDPS